MADVLAPHLGSFVAQNVPLRKFAVSIVGGKDPREVLVEDRKNFTKTIRRHVEKVVERGDGTKIIERPLVEMQHTYDFATEMKSDATRAYNEYLSLDPKKRGGFSTAQLAIKDLGPDSPDQPAERRSRREQSAA